MHLPIDDAEHQLQVRCEPVRRGDRTHKCIILSHNLVSTVH